MERWKNGFRARTTRGSARQGPINFPIRLFGLLLPIPSQIRGASNTSPISPKDRVPRNRSKFLLQRPLSGETRKLWHGSHIRLHCLLPPPRAGCLSAVGREHSHKEILENRSYPAYCTRSFRAVESLLWISLIEGARVRVELIYESYCIMGPSPQF